MKKHLFFISVLAALLPVFAACNGNKDNGGSESDLKPVTLTTPKEADHALSAKFATPIKVGEEGIHELTFFRSGRFVMTVEEGVKAPVNAEYLYGTYTVNGKTYSLSTGNKVILTVTVDGNSFTVKLPDGTEGSGTGTVTKSSATAGSTQDYASRSWKLNSMKVNITKPDIKHTFKFSGSKNVTDVVAYLTEHKVNIPEVINDKPIADYDVKEVTLDNGVIMIQFTGGFIYKGSWTISGTSFNYNLKEFMSEEVFNAQANGKIEFSANQAIVTINVSTKEMNGTAVLTLDAVN